MSKGKYIVVVQNRDPQYGPVGQWELATREPFPTKEEAEQRVAGYAQPDCDRAIIVWCPKGVTLESTQAPVSVDEKINATLLQAFKDVVGEFEVFKKEATLRITNLELDRVQLTAERDSALSAYEELIIKLKQLEEKYGKLTRLYQSAEAELAQEYGRFNPHTMMVESHEEMEKIREELFPVTEEDDDRKFDIENQ